jgi:AbrB family looped-hinge helix DNA binding protein
MSKVTAKYQITLPVKVRKELGIVPGAEVDIVKKGKKYVLVVDPLQKSEKNGAENSRTDPLLWTISRRSEDQ